MSRLQRTLAYMLLFAVLLALVYLGNGGYASSVFDVKTGNNDVLSPSPIVMQPVNVSNPEFFLNRIKNSH